jgi:hypothetical protein
MSTHSKVQSFISSTRSVFLKYTSPNHRETSPKPSASIAKSDKILEQLSQSLAPLHFDAGDLNRDTPDQRTGMQASGVSVAADISEGRYNPDTVCNIFWPSICMLRLPVQVSTINSDPLFDDNHSIPLTRDDSEALPSGRRAAQHARKHAALHQIRQWEINLNVAKNEVLQCENMLLKLRKEAEEADDSLAMIEESD